MISKVKGSLPNSCNFMKQTQNVILVEPRKRHDPILIGSRIELLKYPYEFLVITAKTRPQERDGGGPANDR